MSVSDLEELPDQTASLGISEKTKRDYNFVMGIDFGTTYSGIAYAKVTHDQHSPVVNDIGKWPGGGHQTTTQVPTRSAYKNGEMTKWWGDLIAKPRKNKGVEIAKMFKLLLNESDSRIVVPPLPEGVDVEKAISNYLQAIYQHAYKRMTDVFGKELDPLKIRFCLTVPAIWTEKAKIIMREAAIQAGIVNASDPQDRLLLVGEPEAAALYCESVIKEYDLDHGDTFLICDAGGGTVDLVVYQISNEEGSDKFLIEVAAGDGGLCGSVNLDNRFRNLVAFWIQQLTNIPLTKDELAEIVKNFVETQKPNVVDPSDDSYDEDAINIDLPSKYEHFDIKEGPVTIADSNLSIELEEIHEKVFDPVVNDVLKLIDSQCNGVEKLDAIFLVGGFGQSSYLFGKIKANFSEKIRLICQPERGQTAIVRGAVLMGLNPLLVKQRVVRRTYGYQYAMEYDDEKDEGRPKVIYKDGKAYCNGRFQQYAKKGDINDIGHYSEAYFTSSYDSKPSIHLFAYDGDINNIPRYTDDPEVKKIMKFDIDMPQLLGRGPTDLVNIDIRFYLYQTEIKLRVNIENQISTHTGYYLKDNDHALDTETEIHNTFGVGNIKNTYSQRHVRPIAPVDDGGIGIQGTIPEEVT